MLDIHNKFGFFFNKHFNVLVISFDDVNKPNNIIEKKSYTILKKDEILVGINIFNLTNFNEEDSFANKLIFANKILQPDYNLIAKNQFVIGQVIECQPIVNTHLNVCQVSIGTETIQIVCGAKNVVKDLLVVVATIGTWMFDGTRILQGKLRDFDSFGMLCSAKEMNLLKNGFNDEGIIELDPNKFGAKIGFDFLGELDHE